MNPMINLRLELDVNAHRMVQSINMQNRDLEAQIAKGIELAINELCDGDNFVQHIKETTKTEINKIVRNSVLSWDVQKTIERTISEKISKKIEEYADMVANKITSSLS